MPVGDSFDNWNEVFLKFQARLSRFFAGSEPREQAGKYIRGLLAPVDRKNGWQIAEAVGDTDPLRTQRLLYGARWDSDAVRDELQKFVSQESGDPDGIGIVDETGFIKKGVKSVGVKRQYSGTAGKIENCQVGVHLAYVGRRGHAFLDRRLYPPEEWITDAKRREEAKIPDEVTFATKIDMAIEMLERAWENEVPMKWVTADEMYGDAHKVRETVSKSGRLYVFGVSIDARVWAEPPNTTEPFKPAKGRPRTRRRLLADSPQSVTVRDLARSWPEEKWRRFAALQGEKGPIVYDWAFQRIVESRDGEPGPDGWVLVRRSTSDPADMAYYLSNAPELTSRGRLKKSSLPSRNLKEYYAACRISMLWNQRILRQQPRRHRGPFSTRTSCYRSDRSDRTASTYASGRSATRSSRTHCSRSYTLGSVAHRSRPRCSCVCCS